MDTLFLNFLQDKHNKRYCTFLLTFTLLLFAAGMGSCLLITNQVKTMLLSHDEAVAASLIGQGVPESVIARALTNYDETASTAGLELLGKIGVTQSLDTRLLPSLHRFQRGAQGYATAALLFLSLLLFSGSLLFLRGRERLYLQADSVIADYIGGDYSRRLPQTKEGTLYQLFSSIDQLATMLQAQKETEYQSKIFLKNTISDISHQLKTPLAALSMYQEIMANEQDASDVIREFATKTGLALRRMEQLIQSMLKITRLDAGSILFEKQVCNLRELIASSLSELTTRAAAERKEIVLEGSLSETITCDPAWTGEAVANLVKNALDHTDPEGVIRVLWDASPLFVRITVCDDGEGIAPEDIHHIFKRFYRSRSSSDRQGTGLGLPLAKSIVEGQGGTVCVRSEPHIGTAFVILFPKVDAGKSAKPAEPFSHLTKL